MQIHNDLKIYHTPRTDQFKIQYKQVTIHNKHQYPIIFIVTLPFLCNLKYTRTVVH